MDPHYHLPFERRKFIKEQLFRVNADGDCVLARQLSQTLTLPASRNDCKTFSDFIFAKITKAQQ